MARSRPRIGLALGSGGARGWCHVGALRQLDEMGVRADVVAGCSMGALVGAVWAAGRIEALEDWARAFTRQSYLGYVDLRLAGGGLVRGRAITDMLRELGVPDDFTGLQSRMIVVATDMETGYEVWLQDGSVLEAVRASIAIPGIFSPHRIDGKWLLDGGLINPVPASACRALGADVTISINPNGRHGLALWSPDAESDSFFAKLSEPSLLSRLPEYFGAERAGPDEPEAVPPHYFDVVSTAIDIVTDFVRTTRAASDPAHLSLEADLRQISMLEMYRAAEAIDEGRRIVREKEAELTALLSRFEAD